ncbi:MAG: MBOAT family protein [Magnetococcales bacterium]|nr:MBOAT family protein [Magnetococcales bacterium]
MLFNSSVFFIFIAIFFLFWPLAKQKKNLRFAYLITASFFFYGWWDYRFLFLIIASGLLDYLLAFRIAKSSSLPKKRFFLFASLLGNIGSLACFKYLGFFAENLSLLLAGVGIEASLHENIPAFMLILPIGISFYTFQSMSYTIDVYFGRIKPTDNILHFFAYLAMFPQLVAGPILRAKDILPQLLVNRSISEAERWSALQRVVFGFFKKVVIADNLAPIVAAGFASDPDSGTGLYWWFIVTAFAVQIYCDFSGYSDIAIGIAKWMGYDFKTNFNHPYISRSLREFWTRWHISLSSWFRDYLYIPLGGSSRGSWHSYINLFVVFIISGFWHGAAWNFIVWGMLHGLFLSLERLSGWPGRISGWWGGGLLATILVIIQVWIGWVFFRSESFSQAVDILTMMFTLQGGLSFGGVGLSISWQHLQVGGLTMAIIFFRELYVGYSERSGKSWTILESRVFGPLFLAVLIVVSIFFRGAGDEFIYFQF